MAMPYTQPLFSDETVRDHYFHAINIIKTRGTCRNFRIDATIQNGISYGTLAIMLPTGNWEQLENNHTIMGNIKVPSYAACPADKREWYQDWQDSCIEYIEKLGY